VIKETVKHWWNVRMVKGIPDGVKRAATMRVKKYVARLGVLAEVLMIGVVCCFCAGRGQSEGGVGYLEKG
jgi:hypothetical protein